MSAKSDAEQLETRVRERVAVLVEALVARDLTVATAESLTGGLCSYHIVDAPDSGKVMLGAVVAYSSGEKRRLLGVEDGPVVSPGCALQMAEGVQRLFAADCALAFTGVAGPATQEGQPVGTVFIAVACAEERRVVGLRLDGTPAEIRLEAIGEGVGLLVEAILAATPETPARDVSMLDRVGKRLDA
jgi:PncC family amidohydrolase